MAKKSMTSKQYEELCRFFLANELGTPVEEIDSGTVRRRCFDTSA